MIILFLGGWGENVLTVIHSSEGKFCRDLHKLITAALPSDILMVGGGGDLSARVGGSAKMWKKIIEPQRITLFLHGEKAKPKLVIIENSFNHPS